MFVVLYLDLMSYNNVMAAYRMSYNNVMAAYRMSYNNVMAAYRMSYNNAGIRTLERRDSRAQD